LQIGCGRRNTAKKNQNNNKKLRRGGRRCPAVRKKEKKGKHRRFTSNLGPRMTSGNRAQSKKKQGQTLPRKKSLAMRKAHVHLRKERKKSEELSLHTESACQGKSKDDGPGVGKHGGWKGEMTA